MQSLTNRFENEVFALYVELLKAEYRIHPQFSHAKRIWAEKLTMTELVNGPYLEKSQMYELGDDLDQLGLHEKTRTTISQRLGGRRLYKHQTDALKLILNQQNAVIATGTSSGKTLCYQIPILDDLLPESSPGLRAIIIYPLNALVNDQLTEWEEMLRAYPQLTFARFTGQTPKNQKDYEAREKDVITQQLTDERMTQHELQREIQRRWQEKLDNDPQNRLNHREAIRTTPPHILITNFSMLEYLMERPVDAPIFQDARLKFLVLDEAHAYRGVQATEIAFLVRRLKDRLRLEKLTCIATSATLGDPSKDESKAKVRQFASDLFGERFDEPNPIYGTPAQPEFAFPLYDPSPPQYIDAIDLLRAGKADAALRRLTPNSSIQSLNEFFSHDHNLYRLRKEVLTKPVLLKDAAAALWGNDTQAADGLQALLEIAAFIKQDQGHDDLLPTRLHYFVRAQDGLHVCLNPTCAGRRDGKAAYFVSRKNGDETPEGKCTFCNSLLVEVVTCRKCGWLYGALQDMGPRRAQNPEHDETEIKPAFDSFQTELGWASDSFWSYFSVANDLPFPERPQNDDDEDDTDKLLLNPRKLQWCTTCGKKKDDGAGDNCTCAAPQLREIQIFHRQCEASKYENIYNQKKKPLTACPNCGARNASGLEPVRRFQESDDETGLAMALPLSHFQVSPPPANSKPPRKLLCFTDHRQRAAAFPALLEEETFAHDLGRKIVEIINAKQRLELSLLGEALAELADPRSSRHDPDFFLPSSRMPDDKLDAKGKANLWLAETFSYFGIPDSARESAEDLGLVAVEYAVKENEQQLFHSLLRKETALTDFSLADSTAALQTLLGYLRQKKIFTLPKGVSHDDVAFGRVTADIACAEKRESNTIIGWLPSYGDNLFSDYLRRLFKLSSEETLKLAKSIWQFLIDRLLIDSSNKGRWKIDHERLFIVKPKARFVCDRCNIVTAYSARQCCPRKGCSGQLKAQPFRAEQENLIGRWVANDEAIHFTTLKSEEHTAQINKDIAKRIEDDFRGEGVNLLSSTTTFEMGINIGDLQKVLLRNAPPTSASYVQRVGRAGRGKDKNAVCVTLCRRTKYDADAWLDPSSRLMSGNVRTPTVFTQNRIIAQRHFNAVAFARFLRIRLADEQQLGTEVGQQIPLAAFLPLEARANIPESWLPFLRANLWLNFTGWLETQSEAQIFSTQAGRDLLLGLSGFEMACAKTKEAYDQTLQAVVEELSVLKEEYKKTVTKVGASAAVNLERAIQSLLKSDVIAGLAKRGFLPRYAFPLDTVTLETSWSRWETKEVELSRDRAIAIAEFAPGAQVVARKKIFTSAGLYIIGNDRPSRRWFYECPDCKQIRTSLPEAKESLKGECDVCKKSITDQFIKPFVEPVAFSIKMDKSKNAGERLRRTSLIRQRQSATRFIDSMADTVFQEAGNFQLALKEAGNLFRYNLGPKNEGFILCPACGHSEPKHGAKAGKNHQRLRPVSGNFDCKNERPWTKPLAYGHQFESYCLIARPTFICAEGHTISLAYALRKGLCSVLEVETSDIGVSWRWLANKKQGDQRAEIILYDLTPGGAGFVKEGQEHWASVVAKAREACEKCTCEQACYDCLKDYSNQSYHEKLDRQKAFDVLSS